MGKLRLKLQAMMPSVWYRRLKMELGMRIGGSHPAAMNYKRWSSQRKQLGSSKKLLKASPLISSSAPPSLAEAKAYNSHRKPPPTQLAEERLECPASQAHSTTPGPLLEDGGTHFAASNSAASIAQSMATPSHIAAEKPAGIHAHKEPLSLQDREPHLVDAPCNINQFPQQAPSLSSPLPLSDKSFQIDVQELSSKLKALNEQERRTYYASPIFAALTPTPVLEKLDLDFMVNALTESNNEHFVARKLFPGEGKVNSNEVSRSSYGSMSFTGQSITSSEDTAFDKASSGSVWERDFSSLASEGSELFPAMEKIRKTVAFLRRKSRKARKEASTKQRRRHKDLRCRPPHAVDEAGHQLDGGNHCKVILGECRPIEEVSSIQKLKAALAGSRAHVLHSAFAHEAKSMQAQSEYNLNAKVQENGEDFVRHRRSVSNESLLLESMGVRPASNRLSPWQYIIEGNGMFSPNHCSDSAFSDSELEGCRNHRRAGMPQSFNCTSEHRRVPPNQAVYPDQYSLNASPLYTGNYPQACFPARRECPADLHHSPFSKSKSMCRSFHSHVYDGSKSVSSPSKARLDANLCQYPPYQGRGRYRWGAPGDSPNHIDFMLSKNRKVDPSMDSPCSSSSTRQALNSVLHDNYCRDCLKSKNTSMASPESSSRGKVLKNTSSILSDGDDYDGDVSLRSFNEGPLDSGCKSCSRTEQHRKVCGNRAPLCRNSCAFCPATVVQGQVWPVQKNVCERTVNGDLQSGESLHGLISVPSWSKIYSKGERGIGQYSDRLSFSRSPISSSILMKDDASENDCKLPVHASLHVRYGEQDGNENVQSHGDVAGAWPRNWSASMRPEADDRECNDSVQALIEREMMGGRAGGTMSKSHSRREEVNGMECRVELKEEEEEEDSKKGREREENERGGLRSGFKGAGGGVKKVAASAREEESNIEKSFVMEKESNNTEKSKVYESFAMVKCSNNPSQDFKESMMEMVLHKKLHESLDLVELLQCYLSLNSPCYHDTIVKAFIDLWSDLFHPSI